MADDADATAVEKMLREQSLAAERVERDDAVSHVERGSRRVNNVIAGIGGLLIVVVVLLTVVDVTGRYLFDAPLPGTLEIQQILLAYIALVPLAYTLITGGHVRFTLIIDRFRGRVRPILEILSALIGIAVFVVLARGGWESFESSWAVREMMAATVPLPYWLPKAMLPLGAALMTIQLLLVVARQVTMLVRPQRQRPQRSVPPAAQE